MRERLTGLLLAGQPGIVGAEIDIRHRLTRHDINIATYLDRLMGIFCGVAQAGGFWSAGRHEQRNQLEWLLPASLVNGDLVSRVRVSELDPRMWQCWRHMVSRLARVDMDVVDVTLMVQAAAGLAGAEWQEIEAVDEHNEMEAYPLASPELMAVLCFEDNDAAKSRRCLIEIDRPLQPEEVRAFESGMQAWYAMLETAAFSLPVGAPYEEECLGGSISQFDETTLELTVDRFRASEQAWMVLGNMALAWWRGRARVLRVLVD